MHSKYDKAAVYISVIIEAVLIFSVTKCIIQETLSNVWLYFPAIVCIPLPFIISFIAGKKRLLLPNSFNLIAVLFIIAALYLGEINNFYVKFPWWDLFLHGFFGYYMVVISFHSIHKVIRRGIDVSKNRFTMFTVIFAFSFTITLGTIWEIFEFLGDFIFKSGMIKGGIEDTSTDLIVKITAAFITSTYYYLKNK